MRRSLTASILVALAALPGAAAAAPVTAPPCHRTAAEPRVVATRTVTAAGRAAIVACDRAHGRRTTLRRGFGVGPPRLPALGAPVVQGTKVIWSELVGRVAHPRQDLRTVDVRHPAVQRHRRIGPAAKHTPLLSVGEQPVVALPHGALAYITYGTSTEGGPLVLERPGHARRTLDRDVTGVHVEDGRTLAWTGFGGAQRSLDLVPVPRDAAGCPMRTAFRAVLDTAELRVTVADEGDDGAGTRLEAYRVCWKATGRDGIAYSSSPGTSVAAPLAAQGPYVALPVAFVDKYQQCGGAGSSVAVHVVDARTSVARVRLTGGCVALRAVAVTATGVLAVLGADEQGALHVWSAGADGRVADLDTGPAGSLADLAATATGFTWTHDGLPRAGP